jgi:translocation and assembly module TamA
MNCRSAPGAALGGLLLAVLLLLAGCANLTAWLPKAAPDPVPEQPAASADPERAVYQFDVAAPAELRNLLSTYLDLSRFQNAPGPEGITDAELDRLILAAPAQARSLLETEGYFNADVTVSKAVTTTAAVRVQVTPGPRALVEGFDLAVEGDLLASANAQEPAARELVAQVRRQWTLQTGQAFRQTAWTGAKAAAIAELRAEGYPTAAWRSTQARVDAGKNSVRLEVVADSGPLFRFGEIRVEGLQRFDADAVRRLSTFNRGTPYSEKLLLDFQERLQKAGLFEGSSVEIDPDPATAAAAPVIVRVRELNMQQATVGVGYSANTGPRLTLEHLHRRVFGTRWIAKNKFELGPSIQSWSGEFTSHPLEGRYRNLLSASAERLRSTEELRTSWSARAGRTQDTPRIERLYFAEFIQSQLANPSGTTQSSALSVNYHWVWRDVDSVLLPTQGLTSNLQAALGRSFANQQPDGPFGRAFGRVTWYRPLGASWYATVRGEAGHIFAADAVSLPDTLLFRAGGDDSVRGYAYRSLGPKLDNVVFSGRVLLTGSAEIARPISPKYPAFWWAAFVDAGNAANSWKDLKPVLGYGLGLRWRSPVGPLRLDVAYGQETRAARLHLSVGIAF